MPFITYSVLCILLAFSMATASAEPASQKNSSSEVKEKSSACKHAINRPCIGLVLGGGGARGSAHVGVLKAIEELNIPIDIAVGTSVGSFVAGLYATNHRAAEIEQVFLTTDWETGYQDDQPRSLIPNRLKERNDLFPIQLRIGLDFDGFKLPQGIIQGQGMKAIIDDSLGIYPEVESFDDLAIPYRAVASDAATGEEVVIAKGDLATAMQASMSLPGILRPVSIDGRLLVDGGIANNLPVSVARSMGAELIIAVDIGTPSLEKDQLVSTLDIVNQMTNFLTQSNQQVARDSLTPQDIHITPNLDLVGTVSFDQMPEGIDSGYRAAKFSFKKLFANNPAIQTDGSSSAQAKREFTLEESENKIIDRIELVNDSRLGDDYILHRMQINAGEPYSHDKIAKGIQRLYGQGTIARASTSTREENDETILVVTVEEKEWGPGYLDFKLKFEDDFKSFSLFGIGASWQYTNLNPYGATWTNEVEFGTFKRLSSDLYWPINTSGIFWYGEAENSREVSAYQQNNGSYGDTIITLLSAGGGAGVEWSDQLTARVGVEAETGNVKLPAILQAVFNRDRISVDRQAMIARARYDSLDDAYFSTDGWRLDASFSSSNDRLLGREEAIQMLELEASFAWAYGNHTIKPLIRKQSTYSDVIEPLLGTYDLGGFLNLSGNERSFITGPHLVFSRVVYAYELSQNKVGAINLPLYLGASYERGNTWRSEGQVSWSDMISSGSVFLGWDSPLGPAFFGYGLSDTGKDSLYVSVGGGY
jgi:NTE family protein